MPINEKGTVYMTRADWEKQYKRAKKRLVETAIDWSRCHYRVEYTQRRIDRITQNGGSLVELEYMHEDLLTHRRDLDVIQQRMNNVVGRLRWLEHRLSRLDD